MDTLHLLTDTTDLLGDIHYPLGATHVLRLIISLLEGTAYLGGCTSALKDHILDRALHTPA